MQVLIVGEAWFKNVTDYKGCDFTTSGYYEESVRWIKEALESENIEVAYLPTLKAQWEFPDSAEELKEYDALILSDIGSNTLLLHPDTLNRSIKRKNRLQAIKDYVVRGGGFGMIGGWMSFQGQHGKANYKDTVIEEILPVELMAYDDRREVPEGARVEIVQKQHPIFKKVGDSWPDFLGYNRLAAKNEGSVLAQIGTDTFMAAWDYERGRTLAFASDCAPHWATPEFLDWSYFSRFWANVVSWLAKTI